MNFQKAFEASVAASVAADHAKEQYDKAYSDLDIARIEGDEGQWAAATFNSALEELSQALETERCAKEAMRIASA